MKEKILVIILCLFLITIGLSGCNENTRNQDQINNFIGSWKGTSTFLNITSNVTFTFYEDKTAQQISNEAHPHWFNFEVDENCLYLYFQEFPQIQPICYYYEFSKNNDTLSLTNESIDTLSLIKQ